MNARLGLLALFLACIAAALTPYARAADGLQAKDQRDLADVVRAWNQGNSAVALKTLATMVARLSDQQLEQVDQLLVKQDLPTAGKLLADARLALVVQGNEKSLPIPGAREAILVLPQFHAEVQAVLEGLLQEPILADPLPVPASVEGFESPLWNAHVLKNKLANTQRFARYMADLVKRVPRAQVAKLTAEQRKPLEMNYDEVVDQVKLYARVVEEREIELRLRRLELAQGVLAKPQLTRERWFAAGAWSVDAFLVQEFLSKLKGEKPLRQALQASDLGKRIERLANESGKSAGDLTAKVSLFNVALHWWLRGRYGQGTEFYGLAKSQLALRSSSGEFALTMPSVTPVPTDPTSLTSLSLVPQYDRRHHYWWGWESRQVSRRGVHQDTTSNSEQIAGDPRIQSVKAKNTSFS
jgi:hypothetical protein